MIEACGDPGAVGVEVVFWGVEVGTRVGVGTGVELGVGVGWIGLVALTI